MNKTKKGQAKQQFLILNSQFYTGKERVGVITICNDPVFFIQHVSLQTVFTHLVCIQTLQERYPSGTGFNFPEFP